jgi:zinc finger SWIM domain-containing protein 3
MNSMKDIHRVYCIEIPYQRAHAAKERALNLINGTNEELFVNLPEYCEQLLAANPGTIMTHEGTDTNQFCTFFLCFDASAKRFA